MRTDMVSKCLETSRKAVRMLLTTDHRQLTTIPVGGVVTGHHHAADALKELIDMGDAPSCSVCGAIMTRNGSCYRCMSCGSTSGCS